MKVERASVSSVKERLEALKRKKEEPEANKEYGKETKYAIRDRKGRSTHYTTTLPLFALLMNPLDLKSRVDELKQQEHDEKIRKKERKRQKKSEKQQETQQSTEDDEMAKMMGFGGFGSSKAS